jgi:hypothetical protein
MTMLEVLEMGSYLVTIVGLPLAILVFLHERRREARNEEAEIYQKLSDEYADFLRLVIENPDLGLLKQGKAAQLLSEEQTERKSAIFRLLVALFERAYILAYGEHMTVQQRRQWQSWEDYMREWTRREDFCQALPELLDGEDPDFVTHITRIAKGTAITGN